MLQAFAADQVTIQLSNEIAARGAIIEGQQEEIKKLQEQIKGVIDERDKAQAKVKTFEGNEAKSVAEMNAKAEAAPVALTADTKKEVPA